MKLTAGSHSLQKNLNVKQAEAVSLEFLNSKNFLSLRFLMQPEMDCARAAKHVNLNSPEAVKEFIAEASWSNGYKDNMVNAYNHYAVFHRLSWKRPQYQRAFSIK